MANLADNGQLLSLYSLKSQPIDSFDLGFYGQIRGIDFDGIRSFSEWADRPLAVALVALGKLSFEFVELYVGTKRVEFVLTPLCSNGRIGDEEYLEFGFRKDDGTDVASFEYDSSILADRALLFYELGANFWIRRELACEQRDIGLKYLGAHIDSAKTDITLTIEGYLGIVKQIVNGGRTRLVALAHLHQQSKGAIHRARVQMQKSQTLRDALGGRALAGRGRSVNGDNDTVRTQ